MAAARLLVLQSLTIAGNMNSWQGLLDLSGNDLILKGGAPSDLLTLANELKSGFNAGHGYWNGAEAASSHPPASLPTPGSLRHSAIAKATCSALFDDVATSTNDAAIKYTYYGDADLNGSVNGADYHQIDMGFGARATSWSSGDFNFDSTVNGSDYAQIDNTFNQLGTRGLSNTSAGGDRRGGRPNRDGSNPRLISFQPGPDRRGRRDRIRWQTFWRTRVVGIRSGSKRGPRPAI